MFEVSLTGSGGAQAWMNTRKAGEGQTVISEYFSCFEVPIRAVPNIGYEFVKWEINGVFYHEPEIRVNADMVNGGERLNITLHTNKLVDGMPLQISEVSTERRAGWVELYNPNNTAVSTRDYFLSDDSINLMRWKIPTFTIQPHSSIIIVMNNNRTPDALLKPQTNFNLSAGETLFLSDNSGNILARALIPELESGQRLIRTENGAYEIINVD